MYLLGYDIGSSSVKTALLDAQTRQVIASVQFPSQELEMISLQSGWAEQEPEVWWENLCLGTQHILRENDIAAADIAGIGIAYQMHGLVLVDRELKTLRPAIIWCDSRAVEIGQQAFDEMGHSFCLENFLNAPGNFTASKLKWVKEHEPETYAQVHKILLPGDYIAMRLTGQLSTTVSGLSEGILWNFKNDAPATELLGHYGIDAALLPDLHGTFEVSGEVSTEAAQQTGLRAGTPLTYRAGDQPNNALSLNVLEPGEVAATCGTSGVIYGVVDRPLYDVKNRVNAFAHVNHRESSETGEDRIGILLCINGAGIQYNWLRQQFGPAGADAYNDMEVAATEIPIGADGICLLPFGNGAERMLENRDLGSHILNLSFNRHGRAHLYRAALEGVAFAFVYGARILQEIGLSVDVLRVGNDNLFQSALFSQTISTLLGSQIEVVETTGAIGSARAAGVGVGIYGSLREAMQLEQPKRVYEPDKQQERYLAAYHKWLAHLEKLKENA